ncbi:MAG TPA: hypothetical protein VJZ04_10970 [Lachnospiraceae bacterium]|nr:hypothetical protein [Lachnospiraceae bacterium]
MLNEKRIILMTKMASYEEHEGKKNGAIGNYFRGDYIGLQVIKSMISATIAFFVVLLMYVFYEFEGIMQDIYKADLLVLGKKSLLIFAIVVAGYSLISYAIYSSRYSHAKKKQKIYSNHLKQLAEMYSKESKRI